MGASTKQRGAGMNKHTASIIALVILLPHCMMVNKKKIFEPIQQQSKQRINAQPQWRTTPNMLQATEALARGITLQDAIALGLNHNPTLQANFEEIGIRKADLIQAGFYTNPHIESIFRIPKKDDDHTNIELSASFLLSDLWQVPLRKRVAQDNLEVKTYEIVTEILQLRKEIQLKYITCVHNQEYLQLVREITAVVETLKERIDYRYQFGYGTKLDKYFAESKLGEWRAKTIDAEAAVRTAYIALHEILGGSISSQTITLLNTLPLAHLNKSQETLEDFALSSHPMVLIEQAKMARAKHSISYEASRIIDNVQFGISYERDFEKGTSGVGPSFGVSIPLFNTNSGNIEHARFEYKQAEKSLYAQQLMILKNITTRYLTYQSYLDQIALYNQEVLPPAMKAIEFSKEFFDRMQMSMILFLETQIDLFQNKLKLLNLQHNALQEYVELEFAVGAQMNNLDF